MFNYETALSALIYSGAICLLFGVVFSTFHSAVMAHRDRNAENMRMEINAELDEFKYQQEAYWIGRNKEYRSYGLFI